MNRFHPFKPYKRKKFLVYAPEQLHTQLKDMAAKEDVSMNELVVRTLVKMVVNDLYIKGKYPHFT